MKRFFLPLFLAVPFVCAVALPLRPQAAPPPLVPSGGLEIVGPTVLMNDARRTSVAIFDLRAAGRAVPYASRDLKASVAKNAAIFAIGEPEAAQKWANQRGFKTVSIVPPSMIEFENLKGVPQIEPRNAAHKNWPLFDVSEQFEFEAERLPHSQRFDYEDFHTRRWGQLPRHRPFIVACRVGHRSQLVVQELRRAGYDARNLRGGLWEWQCQQLPLEIAQR